MQKLQFTAIAIVVLLTGCKPTLDCDSNEVRLAVIDAVSDDAFNPLARFAENNATPTASLRKEKPVYQLTQRLVTNAASKDRRTLQCSGGISVLYGDIRATKDIDFELQQASAGKLSVSVTPFQF